jgi:hypothetical protein
MDRPTHFLGAIDYQQFSVFYFEIEHIKANLLSAAVSNHIDLDGTSLRCWVKPERAQNFGLIQQKKNTN